MTQNELFDLIDCVAKQSAKEAGVQLSKDMNKNLFSRIWMQIMLHVINRPVRLYVGYGNGSIQVLQHASKKGYEWDKIYDFWDWTITWAMPFRHAKVMFDKYYYGFLYNKAKHGKRYLTDKQEMKDPWLAYLLQKNANK